jgi:hypothetical protein
MTVQPTLQISDWGDTPDNSMISGATTQHARTH